MDEQKKIPLWRKVKAYILYQYIEKLEENAKLPSDQEIVNEFGISEQQSISVQPVIRAMKELEREGLIERRVGDVSIVAPRRQVIEDPLSFADKVTQKYGEGKLQNKIIELSCRLPMNQDPNFPERKIQTKLGLRRNTPFYIIKRLRIIENRPCAIHTSYLRPGHFPENFLAKHNFEKESLIELLKFYGYKIVRRETNLRARLSTNEEKNLLNLNIDDHIPVLGSDQISEALHMPTKDLVIIEYMQGCYLNWDYHICTRFP